MSGIFSDAAENVKRAAQCDGKVVFKGRRQAGEAAKRREGRVVYRCPHCHFWHVGWAERREKKFAKRKKLIRLFVEKEWTDG